MKDQRLLALEIAIKAHQWQEDKGGHPYVMHPIQVAHSVTEHNEQVVALLHDVVEDTKWTLDDLRKAGFSEEIITAVDAITRREGEGRGHYLARCKADPIARVVKMADLEHNMDLSRLPVVAEQDLKRNAQYGKEFAYLMEDENSRMYLVVAGIGLRAHHTLLVFAASIDAAINKGIECDKEDGEFCTEYRYSAYHQSFVSNTNSQIKPRRIVR